MKLNTLQMISTSIISFINNNNYYYYYYYGFPYDSHRWIIAIYSIFNSTPCCNTPLRCTLNITYDVRSRPSFSRVTKLHPSIRRKHDCLYFIRSASLYYKRLYGIINNIYALKIVITCKLQFNNKQTISLYKYNCTNNKQFHHNHHRVITWSDGL